MPVDFSLPTSATNSVDRNDASSVAHSVPDDGEASDCEIDVGGPGQGSGLPGSGCQVHVHGQGHSQGVGPLVGTAAQTPDKTDSLFVLNQYLQHQHHYGPRVIR